ncbi:MAG: hypothetical protein Q8938_01085 [Bacteroidota bacterium]|nr:hypothetical protein [Bacteroidota bacterium]
MSSKASDLKALRILFLALLAGQVMLGSIAVLINALRGSALAADPDLARIFLILVPAVAVVLTGCSHILFRKRLEEIRQMTDSDALFLAYRAACIVRWALSEVPSLLAIIAYLLTGKTLLLAIAVALVIHFAIAYPSKDRVMADLQMSSEEM